MIIPVNPDQMLMLEKAQYILNGLYTVVIQFTGESEFKPGTEEYRILLDKYADKYIEVELIKNELIRQYASEYTRGHIIDFDFIKSEITVRRVPPAPRRVPPAPRRPQAAPGKSPLTDEVRREIQ